MYYQYYTGNNATPNRQNPVRYTAQYTVNPMAVLDIVMRQRQAKQAWQSNLYQAR